MSSGPAYGDGTRVVGAGRVDPVPGHPLHDGPVLTSTYHLAPDYPGPAGDPQPYYGRNVNPSWAAFETAVGTLEGGPAVAFASGMAAVSAVLLAALRPGDRVVVPADGYYATRRLLREDLDWVDVVEVRTAELTRVAADGGLAGARLVLAETPSNPGLDVCDLAVVAAAARAAGAVMAVDNTFATPLGQQPLALGADLSLTSDTKAIGGHSDLLLGHVTCRDPAWAERLRARRTRSGAIPGAFDAWLAHRSLATLDVRLTRQAANALALAEVAAQHPAVRRVRYPWRRADPAYALVTRQMRRPIGLFNLELRDAAAVRDLLVASDLLLAATSFGGVHTTVDRRAQWGDDVPEGFVRISCGLEDTADLAADVRRALDSLGSAG